MIRLRYIQPGRYFNGVPARDLTSWDLNQLPDYLTELELIASGVYEPVTDDAEEKQANASPEVNE